MYIGFQVTGFLHVIVCGLQNNKQILDFLNKRVSAWISYEPFLVLDLNHPDFLCENISRWITSFVLASLEKAWTNSSGPMWLNRS